jgi:hypothetical protein
VWRVRSARVVIQAATRCDPWLRAGSCLNGDHPDWQRHQESHDRHQLPRLHCSHGLEAVAAFRRDGRGNIRGRAGRISRAWSTPRCLNHRSARGYHIFRPATGDLDHTRSDRGTAPVAVRDGDHWVDAYRPGDLHTIPASLSSCRSHNEGLPVTPPDPRRKKKPRLGWRPRQAPFAGAVLCTTMAGSRTRRRNAAFTPNEKVWG